jgi:hypothetical protein
MISHRLRQQAGRAACALLLGAVSVSEAATLTTVPMQGGMLMPMITYSNSTGRLQVMMPMSAPQLTPLLVSNPSDSFAPGDPWFAALDPGAQGLSFSRRYGFVIGAGSETLPEGAAIWIRKVSGPADLAAYRYMGSEPKMFEPIFGTAGTSNALYWDGMMFHPTFAAPPGTTTYQAVFEAYLMDTNTNVEVPNTSTPPMLFTFGNLPDGRPDVGLALKFAVTWDTAVTNWAVESSPTMTGTNWTLVTNTAVLVDGESAVILPGAEPGRFYRMRRLP